MDIEQLYNIAIHHAKKIRTRCKFLDIAENYIQNEEDYIFYAVYKCKRSLKVRQIVLDKKGNLIAISI